MSDHNADFTGTERFKVLEPLGQGATAMVYRAFDNRHKEVVALKTLKHLDSNSLYRLKQEFRALSHLDHPNLVSFHELVHEGEDWFVTMELVEGIDFLSFVRGEEAGRASKTRSKTTWASTQAIKPSALTSESKEGPLPKAEPLPGGKLPNMLRLRSTLRQLAEAAATLHAAGRIHRDLKPSNVLITESGRVVVLDFGLVADIDQDFTEGTLHQSIAGSAAYMSPEQSVGLPLTDASDWYSVGVIMYESLTGIWPFTGHLYEILSAKNSDDPVPPKVLLPQCPDELNDLCMALLEREPEARPTGAEVLARLRYRNKEISGRPRLHTRFHGRKKQLSTLRQGMGIADDGQPAVLLIKGEIGVGKTQLIREFVKIVKQQDPEITILKGRCFEWEQLNLKALDGLMDNLSRVLRRVDYSVIRRLANEDLSWLVTLFPVLARVDSLDLSPARDKGASEAEIQEKAYQALVLVIKALATDRPLVLYVDDAQWGDEMSAMFLARLLIENQDLGVLCLFTYSEEPGPFLNYLVSTVQKNGVENAIIDLQPFTFEQSQEVAAEMLGQPAQSPDVLDLAAKSQGNLGSIRELVRQRVVAHGEDEEGKLNEVMLAVLNSLAPDTNRLISVIAIAGGALSTDIALLTSDISQNAFSILTTLRAHRLLRVTGKDQDTLEVSRSVTDWILDRIDTSIRATYSRKIAQAMEISGIYDATALVDLYIQGGDDERAATMAWMSANQAFQTGDYNIALELGHRALTHGKWTSHERRSIQQQLAQAMAKIGRGQEAAELFVQISNEAPGVDASIAKARAAELYVTTGYGYIALPLLTELLDECGLPPFSGDLFSGGLSLFRRWRQRRRGTTFEGKSKAEVDQINLLKVDVAFAASDVLATIDPLKAAPLIPIHQKVALDVGEEYRALRALASEVLRSSEQDDPNLWRATYQEVLAKINTANNQHAAAWLHTYGARAALEHGDFTHAKNLARQGEVLFRRHNHGSWEQMMARVVALEAKVSSGDLLEVKEESEPLLLQAIAAKNLTLQIHLLCDVLLIPRISANKAKPTLELLGDVRTLLQGPVSLLLAKSALAVARLCVALGEPALTELQADPMVSKLEGHTSFAPHYAIALATAALAEPSTKALRTVRYSIDRLTNSRTLWAQTWGSFFEAGLQKESGNSPTAALRQCRSLAKSSEQPILFEISSLLLGEEEASQSLTDRGVVDVEGFVSALNPAF